MALVSDPSYLFASWEEYERNKGTLESWIAFDKRRRQFNEKCARTESCQDVQPERSEKRANEGSTDIPSKRSEVTTLSAQETASQRKKEIRAKKADPSVQRRTVFINNLSFSAEEESVHTLFAPYGTIMGVSVVRNNHGKPRGFAYVEFEREEDAQAALAQNGQDFLGRKLEVKLSVPEGERQHVKRQGGNESSSIPRTIYISGLPPGVSEYEVSVFFSQVVINVSDH